MRITRQKDIFANANRHYSLRKFSVGLASVLICLSFANATKIQTVKADSLNKVPVYLHGNENAVRNEMQQFSSVQNSVALGKQKASTENTQAEAKNQENKLVTQINYKLASENNPDNKKGLEQNLTVPNKTKQGSTITNDSKHHIAQSSLNASFAKIYCSLF